MSDPIIRPSALLIGIRSYKKADTVRLAPAPVPESATVPASTARVPAFTDITTDLDPRAPRGSYVNLRA